jgi:CheY-like chemotaxis protein/anti-sigma regulatory factor (Ser/Thr protein kinase)
MVESIVGIVDPKARDKKLTLNFSIAPDVSRIVIGDSIRIRQILINLLNNAIKFTEQGSVTLRVTEGLDQRLGPEWSLIEVHVVDTGIGIPVEKQKLIFEVFTQADASITRKYGGTGLGLAIVKRLVTLMGGSIEVRSEVGRGSDFVFKLPLRKTEVASLPESEKNESFAHGVLLQGVRVLVVEDIPTSQKLMEIILKNMGCTADIASDGLESIEKIKANVYDVVLMDVQMPVMNGIDAVKVIRASGFSDLPIIALTAGALKQDQEQALAAGMNDYLTKPIDYERLKMKLGIWTKRIGVGDGASP